MQAKPRCDKEYKEQIIKLIMEEDKAVKEVSEEFGLNINTIYTWLRQKRIHKEEAFPGTGSIHLGDLEAKKQAKRIRELEMENEILKKAMAFFAKAPK